MNSQRASQLAGFAAVMIAAAAFIGWWDLLPLLSNRGLSFVTLKPPVALGLAALGIALVHPGMHRRVPSAVGVAVAALAAFLLSMIGVADALGLDGWLAGTSLQVPGVTLLALGLAGGALALGRSERHGVVAIVLAVLTGAIAALAPLGYLTGIGTLHGAKPVSPPSLSTSVALLCVVCGIILRTGRMPTLRTPQPLWRLLLALGCATLAPLLLFGAYAGRQMAMAQLDQVRKDLMSQARTLSAEIDRQIIDEIEKLQALAASPSLRHGDFAAFQRQAEAALALRRSGNITLIDRNMEQLVNTSVPYGTPMPKAVVQGPVERALATGKPQFTGLYVGAITRQLRFAVVAPVEIDGEYRYALVRSPDRHAFAGLVVTRELPPGCQAVVADATHRILAQSGQEDGAIGTTLPEAQWHQGASGIFAFTDVDGRPALQAYAYSDLTGWETAVWEPKVLLEAPVRTLWRTLGWLALLAFALVAALALWLGRLIAGSVGHAASAAVALGEGAPLPPGGTPVAEVNTLLGQLHEAAAGRQAAEYLLRQREDTFRTMFDKSGVGKSEAVPGDGRFLRVNPAMCRFVGYSEAELLDMTVWDITHPDERDREPIRRLVSGELSEFDVEKRYIRKDGTPVWAHTTVNLIRNEQGHPVRAFAVIQDIDARKRAEQALQASKDRLQLALNAAQLGSWQYDPLSGVITGDTRAKEIFDFDIARKEAAIEEVLSRVHPDDEEDVWVAIEESLDPFNPKRSATQFRLQRRSGEVRWVETLGLAYFEGAGAERRGVSIVGTVQDITERKEREEKEHLLMREINHRAKNMLSVVHAIAHQTAARNPEDFIERFSERIQALSANQDLLIRNEWNGVEVGDLVRAQLAHFVSLIGSRIAVSGPRLRLRAATAQAIGLALHELATNAGKYGALSTDEGRVDVGWETDEDTFTMSWRESGGPPVSEPQRRGFGTTVVEMMAERSVAGQVDLDYAPSGVTWRLTCPAANALEGWERDGGSWEQGGRPDDDQTVTDRTDAVPGQAAVDGAAARGVSFPRPPIEEGK